MKIVLVCLLAVILIIIVALVGMFFFFLGWNMFISPVFELPIITLWQAFCAMLIIGVIGGAFKSNIKMDG